MTSDPTPRSWPLLSSERGPDLLVCRARFDRVRNPRNGRELDRTVLEVPDWVNVVALTAEGRLLVVRQWRFGSRGVTCEIPGGVVDAGEGHAQAARRELLEECGYSAPRWTYLGCVEPNPAFHDNLCHHWLAEDAAPAGPQEQDEGEDIAVDLLSLDEVRSAVAAGEIRHALVVSALCRILDLRVPSGG